jgi:telomere length regulation protein
MTRSRWLCHALGLQVDKVKHGVNLLGRDTLVFSRVLATLGTFAECSTATDAALPVACAVLELIASPEVRHPCPAKPRVPVACYVTAHQQVVSAPEVVAFACMLHRLPPPQCCTVFV